MWDGPRIFGIVLFICAALGFVLPIYSHKQEEKQYQEEMNRIRHMYNQIEEGMTHEEVEKILDTECDDVEYEMNGGNDAYVTQEEEQERIDNQSCLYQVDYPDNRESISVQYTDGKVDYAELNNY